MAQLFNAIGRLLAKTVVTAGLSLMPQPAIIVQSVPSLVSTLPASSTMIIPSSLLGFANDASTAASGTPILVAGNLPKVKLLPYKIKGTVKASSTITAAAKVEVALSAPKPIPTPTPIAPRAAAPVNLTAQTILDTSVLSLRENRDGPYEVSFATPLAGGKSFSWNLSQATIGGTAGIPAFSLTYSCDPLPTLPLNTDTDQNPTFAPRTSYTCTLNLAAVSGSDESTHSKSFTFNTGPGQFIITPPSSMDTVLNSAENQGGFVFNNEDTQPVTVSNLTIDVSYTALIMGQGAIVLRFHDPVSDATLMDYHLENIALDPATQYTHDASDIQVPVSFTIPASSEKILPIELLGVRTMSITGVDPAVKVTLHGLVTTPSDAKTVLGQAVISWSCEVPLGFYDPNATSGALASGLACH